MTLDYLTEHGYDCMGVCEYVKINGKFIQQTIEGIRLWKCEGRYYWVEDDKVSIVYNSQLDG
jgi:hypothetical protein